MHSYKLGDRVQVKKSATGYPAHRGRDLVVLHVQDGIVGVGPRGNDPAKAHDSEDGWLAYFPEELLPVLDPLAEGGYLRTAIQEAAMKAAQRHEDNLTSAFGKVYLAWEREGPSSIHHRRAKARLRREWPALAGALDLLSATIRNDPEPRP